MTTYTIIDGEGYVQDRGLTISEAANAVMTSDGREWEIREDSDGLGYTAWGRHQTANLPWGRTKIYSGSADRAVAEQEICEKIVNSERWPGHCEAMTDADYDAMMAQLAIDNGDGDE